MTVPRWDRYPEYRRRCDLMRGDQTSDGDQYGWSTVDSSMPCGEHEGCHVLGYVGDQVGTHRPATRTILSRLPLDRRLETTVEIVR